MVSDAAQPRTFRLAYAPGVTPTKWVRVWRERLPEVSLEFVTLPTAEAAVALGEGEMDAALVRLPLDRDGLSVIPLYTETSVAVAPKDHVITAVDALSLADLAGEVVLHALDDSLEWDTLPGSAAADRPATTADAIELVAAGIGVVVVPQSLARLHHRKDLTYRPVTDAPQSQIGLAWPAGETPELVEEFIGIVRGRTANSSRGEPVPDKPLKASEKTKLKLARRASIAAAQAKAARKSGAQPKAAPTKSAQPKGGGPSKSGGGKGRRGRK